MPIPTFTTTCLSQKTVAKDVIELRVQKPEGFTFKPGQFVLFQVPLVDNPSDIQPRAYSIASAPHDCELLFLIKLLEQGRASNWLRTTVKEGTQFVFTGPFGNFVLAPEEEKKLLFVATGTGMAPFRSMWRDLCKKGDKRPIDIVLGTYNESCIFWSEEFAQLTQDYPRISLHITLSEPGTTWTGHRGWVQKILPSIVHHDFSQSVLYACGNPSMTKEIKMLAVEQWGMDKKCVHVEGYV